MEADFSGYATVANLKCSDGRTIAPDAFKHQDQTKVPLVWQHQHNTPDNVLGHALLENRPDGVYAYGFFNDTEAGLNAKLSVQHGDITALSIYANRLVEKNKHVMHGEIRELSLVLAGANPGAHIDNVNIRHADDSFTELDDEAVIYSGAPLVHSEAEEDMSEDSMEHAEEKTVKDVFDTLSEEQKNVVYYMIGEAVKGGKPDVKHDDMEYVQHTMASLDEDQTEVVMFMLNEALTHADDSDDSDDSDDVVEHADEKTVQDVFDTLDEEQKSVVYYMIGQALEGAESVSHADKENVQGVFETFSDEQKNVVYYMLGQALEQAGENNAAHADVDEDNAAHADNQEGNQMKHNVFETDSTKGTQGPTLSHDDMKEILTNAQRGSTFRTELESYALQHGIDDIETLFPDAKNVSNTPDLLARRSEWAKAVMTETRHTPFSRIRSLYANLTLPEARAKGYVKGNFKQEEFFRVARRVTTPQTVYKKQKLDRDDILDITDFDVVAWLKAEMRLMLEEEIARAVLLGDGRSAGDEDKINEDNIRPIATDSDLYVTYVNVNLSDASSSAEEIVDALTLQRRHYRGSGNPTFYTSETILSRLLLVKDSLGRRIYATVNDLASALRVSKIVTVEIMDEPGNDVVGIVVNLADYTIGADRGGDVAMFDDFDIDYNQQKYLIETRISGALTKPKSALVVKQVASSATLVTPVAPSWNSATHAVTVPTTTGVTYKNKATNATLSNSTPVVLAEDDELTVIAIPSSANTYLESTAQDEFLFTYDRGLVATF